MIRSVGIVGGTGYVGSAIVSSLSGIESISVRTLPRLNLVKKRDTAFLRSLDNIDVVVNAAGLASPLSKMSDEMWMLNAVLPLRIANACCSHGIERFVHISSAAVQSGSRLIDETSSFEPFSPYAKSKAAAEQALLSVDGPTDILIYRPTSVQSADRALTRTLVKYFSTPGIPIIGTGRERLPFALLTSVGAAASHLALLPGRPHAQIFVHPWEGVTQADAFLLLGERRPVCLGRLAHGIASLGLKSLDYAKPAKGFVRRGEGLLGLQRIIANNFKATGFSVADTLIGYREIGESVRGRS